MRDVISKQVSQRKLLGLGLIVVMHASHQLIHDGAKQGLGTVSIFPYHITNAHPFVPVFTFLESFKGIGPLASFFPSNENKKMHDANKQVSLIQRVGNPRETYPR